MFVRRNFKYRGREETRLTSRVQVTLRSLFSAIFRYLFRFQLSGYSNIFTCILTARLRPETTLLSRERTRCVGDNAREEKKAHSFNAHSDPRRGITYRASAFDESQVENRWFVNETKHSPTPSPAVTAGTWKAVAARHSSRDFSGVILS